MKLSSESPVDSISICYKNTQTNETKYIIMEYSTTDDIYKGKLYMDEESSTGLWEVSWIKIIHTNKITTINKTSYDFNSLSFSLFKNSDSLINADFNNDGLVTLTDLSIISLNYNVTSDSPAWDSKFDFNSDNICDIYDLVHVSALIN